MEIQAAREAERQREAEKETERERQRVTRWEDLCVRLGELEEVGCCKEMWEERRGALWANQYNNKKKKIDFEKPQTKARWEDY